MKHMQRSQQNLNKEDRLLKRYFRDDTVQKQCSFNTNSNQHKLGVPFRFNMPEIAYTYDLLRDDLFHPAYNDYVLIEKIYNDFNDEFYK